MPTIKPSKLSRLKANALIGMVSQHMKSYRFSNDDAKRVNMLPEDTGVIVLIILYFIEKEAKVCRSKLEYYLLLLDRKCFEAKGVLLFHWYLLKNGRIKNFRMFIDFMTDKNLITSKGNNYFELRDAGASLIRKYEAELCNINTWLKEILRDWKDKTAPQTQAGVMNTKPSQKYLDAIDNVKSLLGL